LYLEDGLQFSSSDAVAINSYWISICYFMPVIGAILSDTVWGRYKTIFRFSVLYVLGVALLALAAFTSNRPWSLISLFLVAIGAGLKPAVGPFGADQCSFETEKQATSYWFAFYTAINVGSLIAYLVVPIIRFKFGFTGSLLLPAGSMAVSILALVLASRAYTYVPPSGSALLGACRVYWSLCTPCPPAKPQANHEGQRLLTSQPPSSSPTLSFTGLEDVTDQAGEEKLDGPPTTSRNGISGWEKRLEGIPGIAKEDIKIAESIYRLFPFFACLPFFWAVFDSHSSVWILQAKAMDRSFGTLGTIQPDQMPVLDPFLVVTLVPVVDSYLLPAMYKYFPPSLHPTPLRRMQLGMYLSTFAFLLSGMVQSALDAGLRLHVSMQVPQYVLLVLAEVGVSATGLEFFFSQAPPAAKSVVLSLFFCTTALGDLLNGILYSSLGKSLSTSSLIWLVSGCCGFASLAFMVIAWRYTTG